MNDITKLIEYLKTNWETLAEGDKHQLLTYLLENYNTEHIGPIEELINEHIIAPLKKYDPYNVNINKNTLCFCLSHTDGKLFDNLFNNVESSFSDLQKKEIWYDISSNSPKIKESFKALIIRLSKIDEAKSQNDIFVSLDSLKDINLIGDYEYNKDLVSLIDEIKNEYLIKYINTHETYQYLEDDKFMQSALHSSTIQQTLNNRIFSIQYPHSLTTNEIYQFYRTQPHNEQLKIDIKMKENGFVTGFIYEIPHVAQKTIYSCWYASSKMLKPDLADDPQKYYSGLFIFQINSKLSEFGFKSTGSIENFDDLKNHLETKGPLWAGTKIGGGHAIVITGVKYNNLVIYHDPGYGVENISKIGEHKSMTFDQFQSNIWEHAKDRSVWYNPNIEKDLGVQLFQK